MIIKQDLSTTAEMALWYDGCFKRMGGVWQTPESEWEGHLDRAGVKGGVLLDIGCGDGSFLKAAQARGCLVTGIDISSVAVEWARNRGVEANVHSIEDYEGPAFDWIFALGSLEHVIDLSKALDNIHRLLKAEGQFYFYLPNELWQHWDQPNEKTATEDEWSCMFELHNLHTKHVWRNNDCSALWGVKA